MFKFKCKFKYPRSRLTLKSVANYDRKAKHS